jgi:hypothetical protein
MLFLICWNFYITDMFGIKADCSINCLLGVETLHLWVTWESGEFSSPIQRATRTVSVDTQWRKLYTPIQFSTQKVHTGYCISCDCWRFCIGCHVILRERESVCVCVCVNPHTWPWSNVPFRHFVFSYSILLVQYYWWFRYFISGKNWMFP